MTTKKTPARRVLCHRLAADGRPAPAPRPLSFSGHSAAGFARWRHRFLQTLEAAMGPLPRQAPLRAEIIESRRLDGYWREKIVYDVEPGLSACAWLCRPVGKKPGTRPAVLCCHGPGPGKDPLIGWWPDEPLLEYHKMVAPRLAQQGYVSLAPDRRGHGDCSEFTNGYPSGDDLSRLDACCQKRGSSLLALDIRDGRRALDLLAARDDVDATRLATLGIESGATVAAAIAALDSRVAAASLTSFISDAQRFPGMPQLPALAGRAGPIDLCALIAPRPLLLQIPLADVDIPATGARQAARRVQALYRLAHSDACRTVAFDGVMQLDMPSLTQWLQGRFDVEGPPS
ncbi:MAG: alpha/beta fold hydrolase [Lentisphaeria bacterium]|jgi:hypothetical protein|nr:alpha/beta fold hydrolase [Lentisphaeria bacterium]MDP7740549.1 alpha/beta fold hydrolase [Lentisphaeria bacterium]